MAQPQTTHTALTGTPIDTAIQPLMPMFRLVGWQGAALLLLMVFFILGERQKKGILASGRRVGNAEISKATKIAWQQIKSRSRNKVTLYIGRPAVGRRTIWVPNAQEGIGVCGAPGKGKTFSVIDPLIRSALDQSFPTIIYDFKGEQLRRHAAYAASLGYEVYVFAPGFAYSGTINILDFLKDAGDALNAKQLAMVINRNTKTGDKNKQDYFSEAADLLVQALLMLAKGSCYPDLLMAFAILKQPDVARRMLQAQQEGWMDIWAEVSATSLTSVAHAEETSSGIVSSTINTFAPMINREFIASICGKTTIPWEMKGKKLLFFQMDKSTRDVVAPLLASVLHLVVMKNLAQRRSEPLVLAMDEFPTLYLPDITKWISEERENGLVPIVGYQFSPQMENKYGKDLTRIILGDCASKFVFNPQEGATAEEYSKYFDEEEIVIHTRSRTSGKQSSISRAEQYHKRRLFSAGDILRLPKGKCIFVNPTYEGRDEAALPWCFRVKVPRSDLKAEKQSEKLWTMKVEPRLIQRATRLQLSLDDAQLRGEFYDRSDLADSLFPPISEELVQIS